MKLNYIILLVIGLFLLSSCEKSIYSEREKSLFMTPTFGHNVNLDSVQTIYDLVVYFDRTYCEEKSEDKWPILYFDLEKKELVNAQKGKNILAFGIEPSPCPDFVFEYDFTRILEVVKDGYNLEVEEDRIEVDSLNQYVSLQYLNYNRDYRFSHDPESNGIWLITDENDELKSLNKYIAQILEGYKNMAHEYALINFQKNLEQLDEKELKELKNTLIFHLSFKYIEQEPEIKMGY